MTVIPSKYWIKVAIDARKTVRNWPSFFLGEYGTIPGKFILYRLRDGTRLIARIRSDDFVTVLAIWNHLAYVPAGFDMSRCRTIVDIGAHVGFFSLFASARARSARVYAFEPVPQSYDMLIRNLNLNSADNIVPCRLAVSSEDGERKIFLSSRQDLAHTFYPELLEDGRSGEISVPTISLKNIFERFNLSGIDLLKVNCEGSEYEIFTACPEELLHKIGAMCVQYHDIDDRFNGRFLRSYLEERGFKTSLYPNDYYRIIYALKTQ